MSHGTRTIASIDVHAEGEPGLGWRRCTRGELGLGVPFVHQGVLGTTFHGLLHEATSVGRHDAVVPSIQGRAWITGYTQHVLQPTTRSRRASRSGTSGAASATDSVTELVDPPGLRAFDRA